MKYERKEEQERKVLFEIHIVNIATNKHSAIRIMIRIIISYYIEPIDDFDSLNF